MKTTSITNTLARRLALTAFIAIIIWTTLDGLTWFHLNDTIVLGIIGLIPLLLGIPTYRNVRELESNPEAYRANHEG